MGKPPYVKAAIKALQEKEQAEADKRAKDLERRKSAEETCRTGCKLYLARFLGVDPLEIGEGELAPHWKTTREVNPDIIYLGHGGYFWSVHTAYMNRYRDPEAPTANWYGIGLRRQPDHNERHFRAPQLYVGVSSMEQLGVTMEKYGMLGEAVQTY